MKPSERAMRTDNRFAEFLFDGRPDAGYDMDDIQNVEAFISFFRDPLLLLLQNRQFTFTDVYATRFLYDIGDQRYYRFDPGNKIHDPPLMTPGELACPWLEQLKRSKERLSWDAYCATVNYMYDNFRVKLWSMFIQYEFGLTLFGDELRKYYYSWNSTGRGPF